jgi:FtsP/CotA-like multicopper oxidase with cupredoxin domain
MAEETQMRPRTSVPHIADEHFSQDPAGLPAAMPTQTVDLANGDTYDLTAAPVRKQIGNAEARLLAYNGSVPGPTLRVRQGAAITVRFANQIDLESTVHWHGLRLDNRFDGVPHATQAPVPVEGTFEYRIHFPDPGIYWYHPHHREDYGQELGLYGNILVIPADPEYWLPAHREEVLTLDDILIKEGKVAPFSRSQTTHAAMGRFGNVLLAGGETDRVFRVRHGEVVRFYLTNTANTRIFKVALPGATIKLVGGDSGRYEREVFAEEVILGPSERVVIDVLFEQPGHLTLEHRTPRRTYPLTAIEVSAEPAMPPLAEPFTILRQNPEWASERERLAPYLSAPPDKTLAFVAEIDIGAPQVSVTYVCPMHPEIVRDEAGRCPKCGMKLMPAAPDARASEAEADTHHGSADQHAHHEGHGRADELVHLGDVPRQPRGAGHQPTREEHAHHAEPFNPHAGHDQEHQPAPGGGEARHHVHHGHEHEDADGIEWEDEMEDVNRLTTSANTRWNVVDRETGAVNHAIDWQFRVGDRIKLRLVNETDSDHPMPHPFHIHGAGRFVVLARDGVPEANLVWKDTVLVRTGQTVDILLDVTNPGVWMAHCHIAEHHESGMMFAFRVVE